MDSRKTSSKLIFKIHRTFRDLFSPAVKRTLFRFGIVPPPFRIQIDVTDRCNFRCPTCSKWKAVSGKPEMGLNQWETVMNKIADISLLHEISITGGEPFVRSDIFDILHVARQKGLKTVIVSNGWFIGREEIKELNKMGETCLIVSLNSLNPETHDQSRGRPGSHARIMTCIENWKRYGKNVKLCLSTVIMEKNCAELSRITEFVHVNGLNGVIFQILSHQQSHYAFSEGSAMPNSQPTWYTEDPFWVKRTPILRGEIRDLLNNKKNGLVLNPNSQLKSFAPYYENPHAINNQLCIGTFSRLYIDPYGNIRLCYGFPPIGNILQDEPLTIWKSPQARKIRHLAKTCKRSCRLLNNNL